MKASIVTIGDELLNGQTLDTNASWIAVELNKIGLSVHKMLSVADSAEDIKSGLEFVSQQVDFVFITGGLGPTNDDITKKTIADYLEVGMVTNEKILEKIESYFERRGLPLNDANKSLAQVPSNAEIIWNSKGTAAGMWMNTKDCTYISMPGVPYEMRSMMELGIIPKIKSACNLPKMYYQHIQTAGIGESSIEEMIADIQSNLPTYIQLAFLPNLGTVHLRLTGFDWPQSKEDDEVLLEIKSFASQIRKRLEIYVYAQFKQKLSEHIGELLKANNCTIATAESCTGGELAHQIVEVPGSSAYYKGSIIAYGYEQKTSLLNVKEETLLKYGAVSSETVLEMLKGLLNSINADYGISISGIAGPGGGTPDKPIGTVWIAIGTKDKMLSKCFHLPLSRSENITMAVNFALNEMRKFILSTSK